MCRDKIKNFSVNKLCRVYIAHTKKIRAQLRYVFISSPTTFARQLSQKKKNEHQRVQKTPRCTHSHSVGLSNPPPGHCASDLSYNTSASVLLWGCDCPATTPTLRKEARAQNSLDHAKQTRPLHYCSDHQSTIFFDASLPLTLHLLKAPLQLPL